MQQSAYAEKIPLIPPVDAKVVAAIPCLNTQKTIAGIVCAAQKYVGEVIVVDDGSTDATAEAAKKAGAKVISHGMNRGKGAAMKTAARFVDSDIIVFLDGDGQHDPEDIPKLLEPILQGKADFVIGSRYLSKSKNEPNSFLRKASNVGASIAISFIISIMQPIAQIFLQKPQLASFSKNRKINSQNTKVQSSNKFETLKMNYRILNGKFKRITDCTSGFTAMRRDKWCHLNLTSDGYQIETEIIFEQSKHGFIIGETAISCKWGQGVSGVSIIHDGLKTLSLLIKKLVNYSED